jgi:hypothetical protein
MSLHKLSTLSQRQATVAGILRMLEATAAFRAEMLLCCYLKIGRKKQKKPVPKKTAVPL